MRCGRVIYEQTRTRATFNAISGKSLAIIGMPRYFIRHALTSLSAQRGRSLMDRITSG